MSDPAQIDKAIAETARHFGRIDILINNAGQGAFGKIADVSLDHFRRIIDLNVIGVLAAMQAAIPLMREQGGGVIINVSSMVTKMRIPGLAAYAATKSALNMLSDTARVELAQDNIKVVSIFPRLTLTDFHEHSLGELRMPTPQPAGVSPVPVDTPEHVADRILKAVVEDLDEQYME